MTSRRTLPSPAELYPAPHYAVMCARNDGTSRTFQVYADRSEADAVAARLRNVQCPGVAVKVVYPDEN